MEIIKSDKVMFGLTVKATGGLKRADYEPFFDKIKAHEQNVQLICINKEYGKTDTLHYHGIISITKGFFRKRLKVNGFHIKLVEIFDIKGWHSYMTKEGGVQEWNPLNNITDTIIDEDEFIEQELIQSVYDHMGDLIQRDQEMDPIEYDHMEDLIQMDQYGDLI